MILNLQILRAIAATMVVLGHLKFVLPEDIDAMFPPLRGAGLASGVDLFFVLSGFVISFNAQKTDLNWKTFLGNRIIRVMPLFWLLSLPFLSQVISAGLAKGDLPFRVFWNSFFLVPVLDKFAINDPAHPFGWTLSFEMWFYVLFSLLLMVVPAKRVPIALIGVFLVTAPLPFLWHMNWKFPYFAFHPLCWEFAMGCAAFLLTRKQWMNPKAALWLLAAGILLLAVGASVYEHLGWHGRIRMNPIQSAQRAIFWGVPAFLIVVASVFAEPLLPERNAVVRFLLALGAASYAIYLVQPLVFLVLPFVLPPFAGLSWPVTALTSVAICWGAGWYVHQWIELPLLTWIRSLKTRPRTVAETV